MFGQQYVTPSYTVTPRFPQLQPQPQPQVSRVGLINISKQTELGLIIGGVAGFILALALNLPIDTAIAVVAFSALGGLILVYVVPYLIDTIKEFAARASVAAMLG